MVLALEGFLAPISTYKFVPHLANISVHSIFIFDFAANLPVRGESSIYIILKNLIVSQSVNPSLFTRLLPLSQPHMHTVVSLCYLQFRKCMYHYPFEWIHISHLQSGRSLLSRSQFAHRKY